jgi:hypothetical protein
MSDVRPESSTSQLVKVQEPVTAFFNELSAGGDVTLESIIAGLFDATKDLASKTQHNLSIPLTQLEVLAVDAERGDGFNTFPNLGADYRTIMRGYRENKRSEGGFLINVVKEMGIADMERSRVENQGLGGSLLDRGRKQ